MSSDAPTLEAARAVKDEANRLYARHCKVVGVGLTRQGKGYAVKINLEAGAGSETLPRELHGVPLVIEVVGTIRKR
jgi:hypothetical protein